jgi:tartrate-resistant acid phosphatase type 5
MKSVLPLCLVLAVLTSGCRTAATGREGTSVAVNGGNEVVHLLAMGDWGNASPRQKAVAGTLAQYARSADVTFDAMLLAGDNFYVQLSGIDDPQWQSLFEQMYDPEVLNFPFYAVLGNHDYERGKDLTQLAYAEAKPESRWKMPARWYRIDFPRQNPLVTVFMLDSNRDLMGRTLWQEQNQWLRDQLRGGELGRWVICSAHHPLFSNGSHGDNGVLQQTWGPMFEEYGVDFFLAGHDHDLQHLQIPGWDTTFILAGGGGAGVRPMRNDRRGPFSRSVHGFVHLMLTPETATVRYISEAGDSIHTFERDRSSRAVRVLRSTPSDPAQPRSVRSITRPDATTAPATAPAG